MELYIQGHSLISPPHALFTALGYCLHNTSNTHLITKIGLLDSKSNSSLGLVSVCDALVSTCALNNLNIANHISWLSDSTSVGRVLSWLMLVLAYWTCMTVIMQSFCVRDIDQTDFHRSEPSSRTRLMDEHSYQINDILILVIVSRHRGANQIQNVVLNYCEN